MEDTELVKQYLDGDESAFGHIIDTYLGPISYFITRTIGKEHEIDDIAQEVFVKAWKKLDSYDQTKSFKTWLYTIARNTCIDYLRKRKDIMFSQLSNEDDDITFEDTLRDNEPLPDEVFERTETKEMLERLISTLPVHQRSVVGLKTFGELTFEEIAVIEKRPVNTVKSDYRRGIHNLRKKIIHKP